MYENDRYSVVRDPEHYTVIDKQNASKMVFMSSSREQAHRKCRELNAKEGT